MIAALRAILIRCSRMQRNHRGGTVLLSEFLLLLLISDLRSVAAVGSPFPPYGR